MTKHKHLAQEERIVIEHRLTQKESFKSIARELCKDPTTIAKEVRSHIQFRKTGSYGKAFNDCLIRRDCSKHHLCGKSRCKRLCCFCCLYLCSTLCSDYQQESCKKLLNPPYVCNGCKGKRGCTLEKRVYSATHAQKEYEVIRCEARQGIQITEEEALRINCIISPLLMKGQSLHHICINHADEIMMDERSLYNYVDNGLFTAKNLDMPRVV